MRTAEFLRRLRQTGGRGRKLRGLIEILRPYRWRVLAMFVSLVVATGTALAPAPLAKLAIDDGIKRHDVGALDMIVAAFLISAAAYALSSYAQTYLVGWVGQRALQDLRLRLFTHLQSLSLGFYSRNRAGVTISRLTNDVEALDQLVEDGLATLVQSGLMLIGVVVILFVMDPHLALLTCLALPLLAAGGLAFRIASADAYRITREKIAWITGYLQETLSGIRVVRAFGQEPRHVDRFGELNEENRAANMKTVNLNAAYFPAVELLSALVTVEILLIGGYEALNGHASTGVVFAFIAALNNFFDPIQQLSQLYTTYQSGMAALDKIFELLDEQPELSDAPDAIELPRIRGELRFEEVSFRYGSDDGDPWALRDIDLAIPPGQTVALVGETGAGRTTIARLLGRFYDPRSGRVTLDGTDLRQLPDPVLRTEVIVITQENFLFEGSVADNIRLGRPDAPDADVQTAARMIGAHEFIDALPEGYGTPVGKRGGRLSAGQRQLISFARAFLAAPAVLVLDEATSLLDIPSERQVQAALRTVLAGRTAVIIAHRLSTVAIADRVLVLDHGRITEDGPPGELMAGEGEYAALHSSWAASLA